MQQISRWQPRPSGPRSASGVRSGHTRRRSRETATGQVVREGRGVRPSASRRRNITHGRNCASSHLALQPPHCLSKVIPKKKKENWSITPTTASDI